MSVLSEVNQQEVEHLLIQQGLMTQDELGQAKDEATQAKEPILSFLVRSNKVTNEQLTQLTAKVTNIPYVNLSEANIDAEILQLLPKESAQRYMAVPLGEMQNRLAVAMLDAANVQAVDFLSTKIGRPLKVFMASEEGVKKILDQYGADLERGVAGVIDRQAKAEELEAQEEKLRQQEQSKGKKKDKEATQAVTISQDSPISRALSTILEYAAKNSASDVHIEPAEEDLKIRIRVDGVLREIMRLPKSTEPALVSRIKILANLKIDEHRIPQDGQFTIDIEGNDIDLRIAISPVVWGEQVVIRLLDKSSTKLNLEDMGYLGHSLKTIRRGLKNPNGMILTSGPTGSGKSTSMYAMIKEIKNDKINIVTLEDPVEYKIEGINQIQINPGVGLTFASGLRSVLRQDPDIVMVGEIRDKETAELAVQAALTGHLVFSTLHTNSASGILPRLLDMEIEPFLIASTVKTVIGQRLVRRIGKKNEKYQSTPGETQAINQTIGRLLPKSEANKPKVAKYLGYESLPLADQNAYTLYKGIETKSAPGGYKGRMGLYEVFEVNEQIEELILNHSTSGEIQRAAMEQGMVAMREDGYLKALAGKTTIEEVNRVAALDAA